jgi:bla regulator protein BlaR1
MNAQAIEQVVAGITAAGEMMVRASWQASMLALLVILVQRLLRGRAPARWLYLMWGLVLLRLALPVVPASSLSLFNLLEQLNHPAKSEVVEAAPFARSNDVSPAAPAAAALLEPTARPQPAQDAAAMSTMAWQRWLAVGWLVGIVLFALRVAWASVRLGRFVRSVPPVTDPDAGALLRGCADLLGVRHPPQLRSDPRVHSPALVGWLRPKLLLPQSVMDDFDPGELRMIFLHELAHQKRRDVLVNWLATALQAVHWFNPIVWLVMWRVRTDRELACDEIVLSLTGGVERRIYGRTILKLLEALPDGQPGGVLSPAAVAGTGVGILEGKHQMKRRITMIARFGNTTRRWTAVAAILALALAGAALTDAVQAQAPEKPAEKPATAGTASEFRAMAEAASRPADEDPADAAARAALQKRLPEVRFEAVPMTDVVDFLRDVTTANITVNWRALEAAGIDRQAPVSARLQDITFGDALHHILTDLGGETVALGHSVNRGTITISTEDDLSRSTIIEVYEVGDLLMGTEMPGIQSAEPVEKDKGKQLIALVQSMIDPDSWREEGGTIGAISVFGTRLVVIQTPQNQEKIKAFLGQLRSAGQQ